MFSGRSTGGFGSEGVWPNWSLVKAYNGAVDQQLSEDVGISTDVVSIGQLGSAVGRRPDRGVHGKRYVSLQRLHEAGVQRHGGGCSGRIP